MRKEVEDVPGRLHATKHQDGDPNLLIPLVFTHRDLYHMQQFFETRAIDEPYYLHARTAFLLAEALRSALENQNDTPIESL